MGENHRRLGGEQDGVNEMGEELQDGEIQSYFTGSVKSLKNVHVKSALHQTNQGAPNRKKQIKRQVLKTGHHR